MAITVFSYVIAINEGLKDYDKVPIKVFKDKTETKEKSVFRACLNSLLPVIQNFKNLDHFKKIYISRYTHHLKVNQNLKLLNYSSYSV